MKSATALFLGILLLAGSLFPQTDVEEVFKIPNLLTHYQLHKRASGKNFNFWQFLDMHYNASSKHARLPHKGVKIPLFNHLSMGFVFTLTQFQRLASRPCIIPVLPKVWYAYQNLYSYQNLSFILQPPQRLS